jgi:hypothetical protein
MAYADRRALPVHKPVPKRRWLPRRFLTVYLIWLALTVLAVTPELAQYDAEASRISKLADELAGNAEGARATAERIAQAVRERVTLRAAAPSPAIGASAWSTWANGNGDLREGARLLVGLLQARDIPASEVVLTNSRTGFRHVAVGYEDGDAWRLINGLGGSEQFRSWSETNEKPLEALVRRQGAFGGAAVYTTDNPFFDRYSFFDWQAVFGDAAEIYQRIPFPSWIVTAFDSPAVITGLFKIAAAFGVLLVLRALWFAWGRPRSTTA